MNKLQVLAALDLADPFLNFIPNTESKLWGWNGDPSLLNSLIKTTRPRLVIEVGVWLGTSTEAIGSALRQYQLHDASIICVDTWLGSKEHWKEVQMRKDLKLQHGYPTIYFDFLSNIKKLGFENMVVPLPLPSLIASRYLLDAQIVADLIYIDASHDEKDVYDDLIAYWELLAVNGAILGDDWGLSWPSVVLAVKRFCLEKNVPYQLHGVYWIIWKH